MKQKENVPTLYVKCIFKILLLMWRSGKQQLMYNWLWFLSSYCAYKRMFAKGEKSRWKIVSKCNEVFMNIKCKVNEVETMLHLGDI